MKISYYKLERPDVEGGFRSYWLMEGDKQARMIHISSLIRLQGLLFSPGPGGPAGREPRSMAAKKLYYLSRDTLNSIEACCYE